MSKVMDSKLKTILDILKTSSYSKVSCVSNYDQSSFSNVRTTLSKPDWTETGKSSLEGNLSEIESDAGDIVKSASQVQAAVDLLYSSLFVVLQDLERKISLYNQEESRLNALKLAKQNNLEEEK